jgi:hypothetical protein
MSEMNDTTNASELPLETVEEEQRKRIEVASVTIYHYAAGAIVEQKWFDDQPFTWRTEDLEEAIALTEISDINHILFLKEVTEIDFRPAFGERDTWGHGSAIDTVITDEGCEIQDLISADKLLELARRREPIDTMGRRFTENGLVYDTGKVWRFPIALQITEDWRVYPDGSEELQGVSIDLMGVVTSFDGIEIDLVCSEVGNARRSAE